MDEIEDLEAEASTTSEGLAIARKVPNIFVIGKPVLKLRVNGKERRVRRSTFERAIAIAKMYRNSCISLREQLEKQKFNNIK